MTKIEREVRRRERERLRRVNRNGFHVFTTAMQILMVAIALIIGITIWFWAAEQQAQEVQASVLRHHRITASSLVDIPVVEPLPLTPPEDGEPPQAIEIRTATKAEAVPEERWESLGVFKTTGFCNCKKCCGKWAGGKTKSGVYPEEGITIAVDPKVIPLGSKVMIDGIGVRVAQDTGKHIKGKCIDVYYVDHETAWNHGVQYHEVFVLK